MSDQGTGSRCVSRLYCFCRSASRQPGRVHGQAQEEREKEGNRPTPQEKGRGKEAKSQGTIREDGSLTPHPGNRMMFHRAGGLAGRGRCAVPENQLTG